MTELQDHEITDYMFENPLIIETSDIKTVFHVLSTKQGHLQVNLRVTITILDKA